MNNVLKISFLRSRPLKFLIKEILVKDEVVADKQFDQKKVESKIEAQKDLEELEGLE